MAAGANDRFNKVLNGTTRPVATTLSAQKLSGATSCTVVATTGWDTDTAVHGIMYRTDAAGAKVAGSQIDWKGTVSGTTISNFQVTAGTDDTYAIGTTVELAPTAAWGDDMATGALVSLGQDGHISTTGVATFSSHIDVNDSSTAIRDSSDNELVKFSKMASAVNEITVANAATGNPPTISATGGDTNISLKLTPKGTGRVELNGAGAAATATVVGAETTTSTSYTDLATTTDSVTVTIGQSGQALVHILSQMSNNTTNNQVFVSFAVSGASTVAAADANSINYQSYAVSSTHQAGFSMLLTGLTAGSNTFKMKYRVSGGTGTASGRRISVMPL